MWDAASVQNVTLHEFAQRESRSAPLKTMVHARFPKPLAAFLKTAALTEGVSESTVLRYAVEKWATSQGFSRTCL
jgi:hypothetical protein